MHTSQLIARWARTKSGASAPVSAAAHASHAARLRRAPPGAPVTSGTQRCASAVKFTPLTSGQRCSCALAPLLATRMQQPRSAAASWLRARRGIAAARAACCSAAVPAPRNADRKSAALWGLCLVPCLIGARAFPRSAVRYPSRATRHRHAAYGPRRHQWAGHAYRRYRPVPRQQAANPRSSIAAELASPPPLALHNA